MSKHSKQWICPCNNITCTQRHTQREQTKTVTLWISLNNYLEIYEAVMSQNGNVTGCLYLDSNSLIKLI